MYKIHILASMDVWANVAIFTHVWAHDVRLTSFRRLTVVNGTPGKWDVTYSHSYKNMQGYFKNRPYEFNYNSLTH